MRLGQHQEAFFRDLLKLGIHALSLGYEIRGGELQRPIEMQELYIKMGRSKTMRSEHLNKCAIDLYFTKKGKLVYPEELGRYWESLDTRNSAGMFWKSFKDGPHYQRSTR